MRVMVAALIFVVLAVPAIAATSTFTIVRQEVIQIQDGFVLSIEDSEDPTEEFHLFEEGDQVRIYASRQLGGSWEVLATPTYLVYQRDMVASLSWNFFPTDSGDPRTATVIEMQSITAPAGTFDTWKVEITEDGAGTDFVSHFYWADGEGLVREDDLAFGEVVYRSQMTSRTVTGSGYMPLVVGNQWVFNARDVAGEESSISKLKRLFGN